MSSRMPAPSYRELFYTSPPTDLDEIDAFDCPPYTSSLTSVPEAEYIHNPPSLPRETPLLDLESVSNVTESRCRDYHWLAHWDSSFQCRPAAPAERCCSRPSGGWLAYNGEFVKVGLPLPLPPSFLEILGWYGPCLMQWTPSAVRLVLAFLAKCHLVDVRPSSDLFRLFFKPMAVRGQKGLFTFRLNTSPELPLRAGPEDPLHWRKRFFFIRRINAPLEIPSVWRGLRGGACSEPSRDNLKAEIKKLGEHAPHDPFTLCSPEVLAYCGLNQRRIAPGPALETCLFIRSWMLNPLSFKKARLDGPFVSHCGFVYGKERIPSYTEDRLPWIGYLGSHTDEEAITPATSAAAAGLSPCCSSTALNR